MIRNLILVKYKTLSYKAIVVDFLDGNKLKVILEDRPLNLVQEHSTKPNTKQEFKFTINNIVEVNESEVIRTIGHCPKRSFSKLICKKQKTVVINK